MQSTKNINNYGKGRENFLWPNRVGCQVKFPVGCIRAHPGHQHGQTAPPTWGYLPSQQASCKKISYFHLGSADFQSFPAKRDRSTLHCCRVCSCSIRYIAETSSQPGTLLYVRVFILPSCRTHIWVGEACRFLSIYFFHHLQGKKWVPQEPASLPEPIP